MLAVTALSKSYDGERGETVAAIRNIAFSVGQGEFVSLLGPSGCGKSTTLRCVAGLERAQCGEITIGDKTVYSSDKNIHVPTYRRDVGMVFQSYAIWPHMTVFGNAAFPLEVEGKLTRDEIRSRTLEILKTVALDGLEERPASKLSGGQQQRLALARALVRRPQLFLLDEPLSNLDAQLRDRMRLELRRLQTALGLTTLYVTHDQTEALSLSDRIAVMNGGEIIQCGPPEEIYNRPANKFVANFVGSTNFIDATVRGKTGEKDTYRVDTGGGPLAIYSQSLLPDGALVTVSVRPENIVITREAPSAALSMAGKVVGRTFLGEHLELQVQCGSVLLLCRCHQSPEVTIGSEVHISVQPRGCVAIPGGI
jgi:iron(III) transport system ATP-binding protein